MTDHMNTLSTRFRRLRQALFGEPKPRVAIVRLEGVIAAGGSRMRNQINLAAVEAQIDAAFSWRGVKAVALAVNSPGGSPVQSGLIADFIRRRAQEEDVPVLAFAEDVAASGGYVLALAGDEVFAHPASVVGSIGVISGGFGFAGVLEKLGVERRVYTAGDRKMMLDPFQPEKDEDVARIREIQSSIHEWFKTYVRDRRGKRLKTPRAKIFSGEVFLGAEAQKLGLIDGIGDLKSVIRDRFGEKTRFRTFSAKRKGFASLLGVGDTHSAAVSLGGGMGDALISRLEDRAHWQRFGQ